DTYKQNQRFCIQVFHRVHIRLIRDTSTTYSTQTKSALYIIYSLNKRKIFYMGLLYKYKSGEKEKSKTLYIIYIDLAFNMFSLPQISGSCLLSSTKMLT
ncbi:LOW QUALITY PROTEIN: hypothetical protein TorRG33x02_337310, partial [Trema orientale]